MRTSTGGHGEAVVLGRPLQRVLSAGNMRARKVAKRVFRKAKTRKRAKILDPYVLQMDKRYAQLDARIQQRVSKRLAEINAVEIYGVAEYFATAEKKPPMPRHA